MTIGIKPILPKRPMFDQAKFDRAVPRTLNRVNDGIEDDFKATYPKPKYDKRRASLTKPIASTSSNDDILRFNVRGTRPHIIRARRARSLRFQTGYRRKVTRGKIGRRAGGSFGSVAFRKVVRHPGQQGTNLDKTIADKWQPKLEKMYRKDIDNAANN